MNDNRQNTSHLLMVRPAHFGYNEETAKNNSFQTMDNGYNPEKVQAEALQEFDIFVDLLRKEGVNVMVVEDSDTPRKPDAVFPNNWISFHGDGSIITYPMYAQKRRHERREEIVEQIGEKFNVENRYSFEHYEDEDKMLEGTGSMVLDRENKKAYACLSPRTNVELLDKFCVLKGYQPIHFTAKSDDVDIYHTNVLMAMGKSCVVICMDAIPEAEDRKMLEKVFERTGKEILRISLTQMNSFAGNMLEIENTEGQRLMVMSTQALDSLKKSQVEQIEKFAKIVASPIFTIEKYGGGSARCMMAEIFLPVKP